MRFSILILASLVLMAMASGCSDNDNGADGAGDERGEGADRSVMSITDALAAAPAEVTVDGFVIETGGEVLLAETLAESFPPQPGGAVLVLDGVDVDALEGASTQGDTTWVDARHRVGGSIQGEVLTVATIERAG